MYSNVKIYSYVYVYIHKHMYIYSYLYIYIHMHISIHLYVYIYIYIYIVRIESYSHADWMQHVRQLIEMLDVVYKDRSQTGLFEKMYDFLTKKLKLQNDLAHCVAFALEVPPARLLQLTNDAISDRLDAVFLEDWLTSSDVTLLLRRLDRYYPNRLQRSQACTISSRANPYVL